MALQSSGPISMTQIYAEVTQVAHNGSTSFTLANLADTADQYGGGFNTIIQTGCLSFTGGLIIIHQLFLQIL